MPYWNPKHKDILFFHVCRRDDDFYLKVDVKNKRVYKCCQESPNKYKFFKKGLYELKWSTFSTGYTWDLKPQNILFKKALEKKDGGVRTTIKHTSEAQWNKAIEELLKTI